MGIYTILGNMVKRWISIMFCAFFIFGCSMNDNQVSKELKEGVDGMAAPNIMINNQHYSTTGIVIENELFDIDGVITSTVDETKIPNKNGQSNFGIGYEYTIINDDVIYINLEGKWIKFERWEP